jgi:hypothetical protein
MDGTTKTHLEPGIYASNFFLSHRSISFPVLGNQEESLSPDFHSEPSDHQTPTQVMLNNLCAEDQDKFLNPVANTK